MLLHAAASQKSCTLVRVRNKNEMAVEVKEGKMKKKGRMCAVEMGTNDPNVWIM